MGPLHTRVLVLLVVVLFLSASSAHGGPPSSPEDGSGQPGDLPQPQARDIILLIGDGMGPHHRAAARYLSVGPAGALAMDGLTVAGYARTYSANALVTDSAAAATAIASGAKTYNGAIGVDAVGNPVKTILEQAQALGKATGLVTTTQIAHATPAAFAAHVTNRSMMTEIARQLLEHGVDVLLGGGEDQWLPTDQAGCFGAGERTDGLNLIRSAITNGYTYVCTPAQFDAINPAVIQKLLGLFADEGMVRPYQPSLADMTGKAIDIVSQDPDGFFLMVEGGQIDWASHANDADNALGDTIGFDEAVAVARQFAAQHPETLVIVTADHETGGLTLEGAGGSPQTFTTPDGAQFTIDWTSNSHTAVDVPVLAEGPHAWALSGSYENTYIFEVMATAFQSPLCRTLGDLNDDGMVDVVDIEWAAANWHRSCSTK
ncbi:MAG: alkaline phosphatase [Anaerolineae bacterium]